MPGRTKVLIGRLAAVALGVALAAVVAEVLARTVRYDPGRVNPGYLQFGYRTGIPVFDEDRVDPQAPPVRVRLFQPDPELLWRTLPDTPFTNAQGFRGRVPAARDKPPGTLRVLFLGDSCTFLGNPVYPELVERDLARRLAPRRVECLNAAVPGYSSFQGRRLYERLAAWRPDAVVIYFGWNDHWPAHGGLPDRVQASLSGGLRTVAIGRAAWAGVVASRSARVPLAEFAANLGAMRDAALARGQVPVFVTAPAGFRDGALPAWAYDFFGDNYAMTAEGVRAIPATHRAYAQAVRGVAADRGAVLVDAERIFRDSGRTDTELFRDDLIHLKAPGHELLARALADGLAAAFAGPEDRAPMQNAPAPPRQ
jgi:lysophospholipase L1-like esterase